VPNYRFWNERAEVARGVREHRVAAEQTAGSSCASRIDSLTSLRTSVLWNWTSFSLMI
jgi:hypothetical protein